MRNPFAFPAPSFDSMRHYGPTRRGVDSRKSTVDSRKSTVCKSTVCKSTVCCAKQIVAASIAEPPKAAKAQVVGVRPRDKLNMEAVVSNILQNRKGEPAGLKKTAMISLAAHAAVFAVIAMIPTIAPRAAQPRVVMNISLGGAPGPNTGGMQMIGGRPIQAALPSTEPQLTKTILPRVTETPKMAMPDPKVKPRTPPKPTVTSKDPKGTAVGRGFETQQGTAKVETGARGQGFGLSSGGSGGDG
ncbi:MAG TPA: hypothetical protein VJM13_10000, partial [Sphingopyxis sp.]|nr:hypothetical protein [Sphingopyxis sp.]